MKKLLYRSFIELTNKRWTSFLLRKFVQSGISARFIPSYINTYKINIAEIEKDYKSYPESSFFFYQKLKRRE